MEKESIHLIYLLYIEVMKMVTVSAREGAVIRRVQRRRITASLADRDETVSTFLHGHFSAPCLEMGRNFELQYVLVNSYIISVPDFRFTQRSC
jgi:hypothetical protein